MGNVRNNSLKEIWQNSEVATLCKNLDSYIHGTCGICEEKKGCYGCRAVPYATFGDLTAPDPLCWRYNPKD